ncbi:hypothetical protein [Viridibacillus arvi]|uniref:Sigma-w pathway protein ysdB n=1 Tax=Viridibacillus arvi TaxID=263475 RepID=A0A0M0LN08_9BACL|nr:hypothetical protein [Viridibacillus arvi]KOO52429.1 sigma-w pathway protein ysdB [Viridibacillus arvi]
MFVLIRVLLVVLILYVMYKVIRYFFNPKRKFDDAVQRRGYYFYDDSKNARKNFFISYKGAMFEGEKYLGTANDTLEVVSIFIDTKNEMELQGLKKDDILFLESEIVLHYPNATISWKNPIEQLMK